MAETDVSPYDALLLVSFGGPDRRCAEEEFEEALSSVLSTDDKVLLETLYRSGYQNYGRE